MGVRVVVPLRVLLPCLAVCLTAAGAAVIGFAVASTAGGFATRQADDAVRACASSVASHGPVSVPGYGLAAVPGSGLVPGPAGAGACGVELVSASGQVLIPAAVGAPAIPASGAWLAAHLAGPVTVPGAGGGGRWRVVITAVRYRAQRMLFVFGPDDLRYVISGRTGHGASGMLIVMAGLVGTGQVAAGYAAVAGTVLALLAAAAFALTRAILRPLRAAAGRAAQAGHEGQLDKPQPASLDRMLCRVTDEITRMETLAAGLRIPSAGESAGPDRRPGPAATDAASGSGRPGPAGRGVRGRRGCRSR